MNKKVIIIHRILFAVNILSILSSLVFYLVKWDSLPEDIGVHFASDGSFDVVESKFYGFYPHIITGVLIIGTAIADHFIAGKQTGLKISEKGESFFKSELLLTLDALLMTFVIYFTVWSFCVSFQTPRNDDIIEMLSFFPVNIGVPAGIIAQIITLFVFRDRTKIEKKDARLSFRVSRLAAWLLAAADILILAVSWERFPHDREFYYNADYYGLAYFANFDAFLDKRLLLILPAAGIILLAVLEIISVKSARFDKKALVKLTDRIKALIGVFFFWWNILLCSEQKIGIVSVCIFAALCALSVIMFAVNTKKEDDT